MRFERSLLGVEIEEKKSVVARGDSDGYMRKEGGGEVDLRNKSGEEFKCVQVS